MALLVSLNACVGVAPGQPGPVAAEASPDYNQEEFIGSSDEAYRLLPNDVLSVQVFREPDLSRDEIIIASDGSISLPLLGEVDAVGLTVNELETYIKSQFGSRYLRDPEVSVNVKEYRSHQVTVEGAVKQPGLYDFRPGTRLSGGIALAQGTVREAKISEIAVFRDMPGGKEVAKFDLAAMRAGTMADPLLRPGDRIVVGTDGLTQLWQDLLRALPAFGLFTQL